VILPGVTAIAFIIVSIVQTLLRWRNGQCREIWRAGHDYGRWFVTKCKRETEKKYEEKGQICCVLLATALYTRSYRLQRRQHNRERQLYAPRVIPGPSQPQGRCRRSRRRRCESQLHALRLRQKTVYVVGALAWCGRTGRGAARCWAAECRLWERREIVLGFAPRWQWQCRRQ
jgi:hypothetical protein